MTNVLRLLWVMCHVLCSRDLPFDSYDRRDLLLHPSARGGAAAVLQGECIARGRTPVVQCWLSFGHRDPVSEPASAHFLRLHSGQRRIGILLWVRRGKQGQSWHIPGMEFEIHQIPPPPKSPSVVYFRQTVRATVLPRVFSDGSFDNIHCVFWSQCCCRC